MILLKLIVIALVGAVVISVIAFEETAFDKELARLSETLVKYTRTMDETVQYLEELAAEVKKFNDLEPEELFEIVKKINAFLDALEDDELKKALLDVLLKNCPLLKLDGERVVLSQEVLNKLTEYDPNAPLPEMKTISKRANKS